MTAPSKGIKDSQDRNNFKHDLCFQWVRLHRPDIYELIRAEADKKFPRVRGASSSETAKVAAMLGK